MKLRLPSREWFSSDTALLVYIAAGKFLLHMLFSSQYGYFRDELYYLAASRRLDFGYVDFPPLIALITALVRVTIGVSLPALRLLPALAGAGVVFLAGKTARLFDAGKFGQSLAALCVFAAPVFLGVNSLMTMDSFEQFFWALALYLLVRLFREDRPELWLAFGLVAGISLTGKISFLYLGPALVAGLILSPQRSAFRRWQLWAGGGIALAFLLPYIVWNVAHGLPTLEFWANYGEKVTRAGPMDFIFQQILIMNPLTLPVWLAGLVFFFLPAGKKFRPFGWMYLVLLAIFIVQGAKFYFLAPFYPVLLAAGAAQAEQLFSRRGLGWVRPASLVTIGFGGLLLAPTAMPLLPVDLELRYQAALSPFVNTNSESAESGALPQVLADQFGWVELADTFADYYHRLPAADQARACIVAGNYGEAGALEFFGRERGLPPVVSGHNSYFIWGPGGCTGEVILYYGFGTERELRSAFESVEWLGFTHCQYCMPYENNRSVYLCKGIKRPLEELWVELKLFL
ncbi:MAG: glycosyltransferase family 39 protein [Anaerolineales bacterium]|nr:glycosyltransferase family 39 protein [Anaerolineales bacterium]